MKRLALLSTLSKKMKDGEIKIILSLAIEKPKTKVLAEQLRFFVKPKKHTKKLDALLIPNHENKNLFRAAANLMKTKVLLPESLNVYDIVNYKHMFIDQDAVSVIEKHYAMKHKT